MGRLPDNSEPAIIQKFWYRGTTRYSFLSSLRDTLAQNQCANTCQGASHRKRQGVVPPYQNIEKVVAAATFSFSPCQRLARI